MFKLSVIALGLAVVLSLPQIATAAPGKHFNKVIYVIFENTDYSDALAQPFMGQLAKQGALLSNIVALVHREHVQSS